ncbi:MAG TPA: hypothetical protein VGX91_11835, partial [Candidatus Cybelea sp.]|nr:hypothetical protein [Candidatus Cybelea sp.]
MGAALSVSSNAQGRSRTDAAEGGWILMASFLGIDLSKETFHASLLSDPGEAKKVFPNTTKG